MAKQTKKLSESDLNTAEWGVKVYWILNGLFEAPDTLLNVRPDGSYVGLHYIVRAATKQGLTAARLKRGLDYLVECNVVFRDNEGYIRFTTTKEIAEKSLGR